jgi:hypothetical protein
MIAKNPLEYSIQCSVLVKNSTRRLWALVESILPRSPDLISVNVMFHHRPHSSSESKVGTPGLRYPYVQTTRGPPI